MASLILLRAFKPLPRRFIRRFAHVVPGFVKPVSEHKLEPQRTSSKLDEFILSFLDTLDSSSNHTAALVKQYHDNRGRELKADVIQPAPDRRINLDANDCPVYLVVHIARNGHRSKVCISSGFKLQIHENHESVVLSCAHTLEVEYRSF